MHFGHGPAIMVHLQAKNFIVEFELIVAKFLYKHGTIDLPGIGTITLKNGAPDPEYVSKNRNIPVEGIEFTYKPGVTLQQPFIDFFAEQKGKIKSLALSDIESKLQLTRQLINIGNPYDVPGVGIFTKQNDGVLRLEPGFYINANQEVANRGYKLKERDQAQSILPSPEEEGDHKKRQIRPFLWVIGVLALVVAGWLAYNFFFAGNGSTEANSNAAADSLQQLVTVPDTLALTPDTNTLRLDSNAAPANQTFIAGDTATFRVYMREVDGKTEALNRFRNTYSRWDNKVYMETTDSLHFKFYVLIKMAVADTTAKRDSLQRFYQYKVQYVPVTP